MQRVVLKKVTKYFESINHNLVIYYHKDLSINDIYNRVIKREDKLKVFDSETNDDEAALTLVVDSTSFLIINSNTNLGAIHHETNHIIMAAFDFMGSFHTEQTDELYAYHSQHIFEFILKTVTTKFGVSIKKLLDF